MLSLTIDAEWWAIGLEGRIYSHHWECELRTPWMICEWLCNSQLKVMRGFLLHDTRARATKSGLAHDSCNRSCSSMRKSQSASGFSLLNLCNLCARSAKSGVAHKLKIGISSHTIQIEQAFTLRCRCSTRVITRVKKRKKRPSVNRLKCVLWQWCTTSDTEWVLLSCGRTRKWLESRSLYCHYLPLILNDSFTYLKRVIHDTLSNVLCCTHCRSLQVEPLL